MEFKSLTLSKGSSERKRFEQVQEPSWFAFIFLMQIELVLAHWIWVRLWQVSRSKRLRLRATGFSHLKYRGAICLRVGLGHEVVLLWLFSVPGLRDMSPALSKIWNVAILFEWYAVRDLAQRECFVGFLWKCPVLSKDKTVTQVVQYGCSGWSLRLYWTKAKVWRCHT